MNKKILTILIGLLIFSIESNAAIYTGSCGDNVIWAYNTETGILAITGTGPMKDYSSSNQPWYSYKSQISSIKIDEGVTTIGKYAFYNTGSYSKGLLSVSIASSVTEIKDYAFEQCQFMQSISIPGSVVSIGEEAFDQCRNLKTVYLNNGLQKIGYSAFSYCDALTSITIPKTVNKIGNVPFKLCESLNSISVEAGNEVYYSKNNCLIEKSSNKLIQGCKKSTIPDGVTCIGTYAFWGSELTSVSFPSSVVRIETGAFRGCQFTDLHIPATLQSIGMDVFNYCDKIETITVDSNNEVYYSENNCLIETATKTIKTGCKNSIIPATVTCIGESAFEGCNGLTSITIPENITSMEQAAFNCCDGLTSITIPNSITVIPGYAFQACPLKSIVIGKKVTTIGNFAFAGCNDITDIYCLAEQIPTTTTYSFSSYIKNAKLHVPYNLKISYLTTNPWSNCTILAEAFLDDKDMFYSNSDDMDVKGIRYTRNFKNTNWQALYVPFEIPYENIKDDFSVAYINDVHQFDDDDDGTIDRTRVEAIKVTGGVLKANYPYMIRAKVAGEKTITVTDATLYAAEENSIDCSSVFDTYTFTGTYSKIPAAELPKEEGYYALSGGSWKQFSSGATSSLGAFRIYMKIDSRHANATVEARAIEMRVIGDDEEETTGVENMVPMVNGQQSTLIYDLQGRRVEHPTKGLYIVNGEKVWIK